VSTSLLAVRRIGTELLDDPAAPAGNVEASLRNIARSNRWFGGAAALRYGLSRVLARVPRGSTLTLLDLGTGSGDLPRIAARWGARRGLRIRPFGVELSPVAARLARSHGVPTAVACAGTPPLRPKSVDLVSLTMVAHHFEPESVVRLFQVCDTLARAGVVVCDLQRTTLGAVAFRVGSRLLGFDPLTIADGLTSIRRGYAPAELRSLLERAGIDAAVVRRPGWRLVATWQPEPAA
jgi:SAM-dependent methyltransferase